MLFDKENEVDYVGESEFQFEVLLCFLIYGPEVRHYRKTLCLEIKVYGFERFEPEIFKYFNLWSRSTTLSKNSVN